MMPEPFGRSSQQYWDDFYRSVLDPEAEVPTPNTLLVDQLDGPSTGSALDLGCGRGGDAIWLASRGWTVTAVDVSAMVLDAAARFASAAGVSDAIDWQRHDLAGSFPSGSFDLVLAVYLHSPVTIPREQVLRSAADTVAPGGTLVIIGHAGNPSWTDADPDVHLPDTDEVIDTLSLPTDRWTLEHVETVSRDVTSPNGEPGTRPDHVVRFRRSP